MLAAVKGGRCFNGAHRDRGQIVHGVITKDGKEPNGYWGSKALCGSEPGLRGYGWSQTDKEVNCTKCLKKLGGNMQGFIGGGETNNLTGRSDPSKTHPSN